MNDEPIDLKKQTILQMELWVGNQPKKGMIPDILPKGAKLGESTRLLGTSRRVTRRDRRAAAARSRSDGDADPAKAGTPDGPA